jgi:hypothetical protein
VDALEVIFIFNQPANEMLPTEDKKRLIIRTTHSKSSWLFQSQVKIPVHPLVTEEYLKNLTSPP